MLSASEVLDRYFLDNRCMLLEIAATLDRLDAAAGRDGDSLPVEDPRFQTIRRSLELLADRSATPDRAERLLHLFSDLD
jgi:hypothetical protein